MIYIDITYLTPTFTPFLFFILGRVCPLAPREMCKEKVFNCKLTSLQKNIHTPNCPSPINLTEPQQWIKGARPKNIKLTFVFSQYFPLFFFQRVPDLLWLTLKQRRVFLSPFSPPIVTSPDQKVFPFLKVNTFYFFPFAPLSG